MNINQHKFMSVVPYSRLKNDKFDFTIGEKVDIEIIGKGVMKGCIKLEDFAYTINKEKTEVILINLEKGKPYIKILYKN